MYVAPGARPPRAKIPINSVEKIPIISDVSGYPDFDQILSRLIRSKKSRLFRTTLYIQGDPREMGTFGYPRKMGTLKSIADQEGSVVLKHRRLQFLLYILILVLLEV